MRTQQTQDLIYKMALSPPYIEYRFKHNLITLALSLSIIEVSVNRLIAVPYLQLYSSSLSRDPLGYVRLVINTTLGYGITASGEIGTLCQAKLVGHFLDSKGLF